MAFDPVSHAAGIGAGEEAASRLRGAVQGAEHNAAMSRIEAEGAQKNMMAVAMALKLERNKTAELQNEIYNKWIPYGVHMKASDIASHVLRDQLIIALRAVDPANVERIVQEAESLAEVEHERLLVPNSQALNEVSQVVMAEAEEIEREQIRLIELEQQRLANDPEEQKRLAEQQKRLAEQEYLNSLPYEIRQLSAEERKQRYLKILNELSMGIISQLPDWVAREQRLCNIFSVKVCRRFHWDDEISLSS